MGSKFGNVSKGGGEIARFGDVKEGELIGKRRVLPRIRTFQKASA